MEQIPLSCLVITEKHIPEKNSPSAGALWKPHRAGNAHAGDSSVTRVGEQQQEQARPLEEPEEIQQDSHIIPPWGSPVSQAGVTGFGVTLGLCWGLRADSGGVRAVFFHPLALFLIFLA